MGLNPTLLFLARLGGLWNFQWGRMIVHRHMRLTFEAGADWLVETLERERGKVAGQTAYALALQTESGL